MAIQFRLLGFPVRVQIWFLLVAFYITYRSGLTTASQIVTGMVVVFLAILLHELGHAVVARGFGCAPEIELHAFGGLTGWRQGPRLSHLQSAAVSASGPAVGIAVGVLALVVIGFLRPSPEAPVTPAVRLLGFALWVNLGWAVLNLAPVLPLDGGNIVTAFADMVWPRRGRIAARVLSLGLTAALALWAVSTRSWWLAIVGALLAAMNWQALQAEQGRRSPAPAPTETPPELRPLADALDHEDWERVTAAAEEILAAASDQDLRIQALHALAWARLARRDPEGARDALEALPVAPHPALLGSLLLDEGKAEEAFPHLHTAVADNPAPHLVERWSRAVSETRRFADALSLLESSAGEAIPPDTIAKLEETAYEANRFQAAADLGMTLFRREHDPDTAVNVACALARSGAREEAIGWLELAVQSGFSDLADLEQEQDLQCLQGMPEFEALRARMRPN